jgi:hypothetical protein
MIGSSCYPYEEADGWLVGRGRTRWVVITVDDDMVEVLYIK